MYNSENYISETIQSCLSQTYKSIEVIIVDDGSTDNSYNIAKRYESDIVKVYQQKNLGACKARNYAFNLSVGQYIQYLDADDIISPNKIENQMSIFKKIDNEIIVSCPFDRFYSDVRECKFPHLSIYKNYSNSKDLLIDMWKNHKFLQTSVWLTHRSIVQKAGIWDEKLLKNQDIDFFCRVLLITRSVYFCSEAKVYYRISKDSITQNKSYNSCFSLLNSFRNYDMYIQNMKDEYLNKVSACYFSGFYFTYYPLYPELLHKAEIYNKSLGYKRFITSPSFPLHYRIMSKIIGFKNIVRMRYLIKSTFRLIENIFKIKNIHLKLKC
jgi:glycosyltransferase involved in cell wall biosynthesis